MKSEWSKQQTKSVCGCVESGIRRREDLRLNVVVCKVGIQASVYETSDPSDPIGVVLLGGEAVNPIWVKRKGGHQNQHKYAFYEI